MITVLHVIDTGGPGGAETVFLNTACGLDTKRVRSICVISRDGWLADALRKREITPIIIPARGSLNFGYLRKLVEIVRKERVDVIAGHLYGSSIYGTLTGLLTGIPVVSVLHGQSDITKGGRLSGLKKLVVGRGARKIVFVSEKLRAELAATLGVAPAKCAVITNGVDMQKFAGGRDLSIRAELGLRNSDILVGAIGNIRKPKAYEVLLRAAHILRNSSDQWHFVIAGEGSNALHDELLSLRHSLGLDNAVTFLGLRSDVARILRNLDVYALSSDTEGFSIACIEAMAAGIPIVATRCGGPEEIIEHERTGFLVPTQDPVSLAAAIARVIEDRQAASEMTKNALQRVFRRYTLPAMLDSYERLFFDLAATN